MSDNENPIPEWMKKKQLENAQVEAQEQLRLQRESADMRLVEIEAPKFWQELLENMKIAVDALPALKLRGSYSLLGLESVRIEMSSPGNFANMTYTDLFRDAGRIRASTLDAGAYSLLFCAVSDTEIGVVDEHKRGHAMNPDEASEYVMKRMLNLIERRRR